MAARRAPTERASDHDLLNRWQGTGRRTLCTPLTLIMIGLTLFSAVAYAIVAPIGIFAGLVLALIGIATIVWFIPIAYMQSRSIDDVPVGAFMLVNPHALLPDVSAVIAAGDTDPGSGAEYYLALQDGRVYARSATRKVDVARMFDPFERWRRPFGADEVLPSEVDWLPLFLECVRDETRFEGSTLNVSARLIDVENAISESVSHQDVPDIHLLVERARGMGLLQRSGNRDDRLRLSDAGVIWLQLVGQQDPVGDAKPEAHDDSLRRELREFLAEVRSEDPVASTVDRVDFPAWVDDLVHRFKRIVESTGAYNALWTPSGEPQNEKGVQALAQAVFQSYCETADIDMTREANASDGPVDFKFSQGWRARALIEVKLLRSSRLARGAQYQLPAYLHAESVDCGYYLCVGFTDRDFHPKRLERVTAECAAASHRSGFQITPVFVDARRRTSASQL